MNCLTQPAIHTRRQMPVMSWRATTLKPSSSSGNPLSSAASKLKSPNDWKQLDGSPNWSWP